MAERISTTAERLKAIMAERKLKQSDIVALSQPFCRKYGVKIGKSDISQYVNAKATPGQHKLTILGMALNVNEAWLMGMDVPEERADLSNVIPYPTNILPPPTLRRVPRVGRIACGKPILAEENVEDYDLVPDGIDCNFTLVCQGDSMINARIYDGDVVCIRSQETVESGEIAAVMVDEDEATLKRIYLYDDHVVLHAENPQYKPMVFWEEEMNRVRIIGLATHFIARIR